MPADQPQVGETWELYDLVTERAAQAVVVELRPTTPGTQGAVRLMNRLGRAMVIPDRSFVTTWRFVAGPSTNTCSTDACSALGLFQVHDERGWVWSCDRHLRVGAQALLPADRPQDRDVLLDSDHQCPQCNTTSDYPGSGEECDLETSLVVHRCGRCGSQWVLILGTGDEADGLTLSEGVSMAAEALHGRVLNIRAVVGQAAWAAIRRVIQPSTQIVGVPLQQGLNIGALNVVVIGSRVATGGVRSLGGIQTTRPATAPSQAILPAVGSLWRDPATSTLVEVRALHDIEGVHEVEFSDGRLLRRMNVREFLRAYAISDTPVDRDVAVPPPIPSNPGPRPGETWWAKSRGTRPVFILGLDIDDNRTQFVRYKDTAEETKKVGVAQFLEDYVYDPPDPGCAPGEEWIDSNGVVYHIDEVRVDRREIVVSSPTSTRGVVPLALFVVRFRKLVRKSVHARLDDDDF